MPNLERDVENRFFDLITKQKENPSSNAFNVYQKLVYFRYEEIIQNTFLEFCKYVDEKELESSILKFMENPPNTPYVWQIAKDYMNFTKKVKLFEDRKYLYELLYFDWIEVELYMKEYKNRKASTFSWNKAYKLSTSARIKKCKYNIINKNYEEKKENFLVVYYDFKSDEVLFREVNQFIYVLIKRLNKNETLEKTLKTLCEENDIDFKKAKAILKKPLKELIKSQVFK